MKINLSQGQFATVDESDFEDVSQFKWSAQWCQNTQSFYAVRTYWQGTKSKREHMHRRICGLGAGRVPEVDHVNHNTLDNRKVNLRTGTHRDNCLNRRDQSKHGVGVQLVNRLTAKPFRAWFRSGDGRWTHIGYFATAEEAREARKHKMPKD